MKHIATQQASKLRVLQAPA